MQDSYFNSDHVWWSVAEVCIFKHGISPHTLSLWACATLPCSQLNPLLLCVLSHLLLCYVSKNQRCTHTDSFGLRDKRIFHGGAEIQGETASSL